MILNATIFALEGAANAIERRGWTRGATERDGRVCAYRALSLCAGSETRHAAVNALVEELNLDPGHRRLCMPAILVTEWNDRQTDRRKVIRALRRTARNLRAAQDA